MRLLQVMASGRHGGAELFYEDLTAALARQGIAQSCVIRPYPDRAAKLAAAGCETTMLRFGGPLDLVTPWRLRGLARDFMPDIVLGWMNRACRILPQGPWVNIGRLGGYYDLKYYRRCDALICNTPDIRQHVIGQGWPSERAYFIPNFCPVESAPAADRQSLATPATARVLLVLARLHAAKGIDVALRALTRIPNAVLWIAGEGPAETELKNLAHELGVAERVRFLGWRDDRSALLKAADVCLLPSRHEPFGNVVVNAWAHGTPLVAAAAQGPSFLVRDGEDGLLVPTDSDARLAEAVNQLLAEGPLRERLRVGGRRRTEAEFSEKSVAMQYLAVFNAVKR